MAEGASFISINPSTLEDSHYWSYADLRTLCKRLQLGANGKRSDLVDRLQSWHKKRHEDGVAALSGSQFDDDADNDNNGEDWLPMNVEGANFAILTQNVIMRNSSNDACEESKGGHRDENPETSMEIEEEEKDVFKIGSKSRRSSLRRKSISVREHLKEGGETMNHGSEKTTKGGSPRSSTKTSLKNGSSSKKKMTFGFGETATIVSPTLLNPLVTMPGDQTAGTPGKSILKRNPSSVSKDGGSATKINFSPFNGTKVIPHRVHRNDNWRKNQEGVVIHEEEEEDDEEEEETFEDDPKELRRLGIDPILYVDREAKLNAEKNAELAAGPFLRTDSSDSDDLLWDRFDGL